MQLVSLRAVRWIGSEKRWIVLCASLQALSFAPLVYAALTISNLAVDALLVASIYWGSGIGDRAGLEHRDRDRAVPAGVRMRYFAGRSRLAQLTTLSGFLLGGAALTMGRHLGEVPAGLALMLCAAGLLRLYSVYWLSPGSVGWAAQVDPTLLPSDPSKAR